MKQLRDTIKTGCDWTYQPDRVYRRAKHLVYDEIMHMPTAFIWSDIRRLIENELYLEVFKEEMK